MKMKTVTLIMMKTKTMMKTKIMMKTRTMKGKKTMMLPKLPCSWISKHSLTI